MTKVLPRNSNADISVAEVIATADSEAIKAKAQNYPKFIKNLILAAYA